MITITTPITDADLAIMRQILNSCSLKQEKQSLQKQLRERHKGEISNLTMSRELGYKIGNVMFRDIAASIGIPVVEHGSHPYIHMSDKDNFVYAYKKYCSRIWNA